MRKPMVENKYNLRPKDIKRAKVLKSERLHEDPFWRNDVVGAWCLSENTSKTVSDYMYCTYNDYWLGFYDDDAKSYAGKIKLSCSAHGGMSNYNFKEFFNPKEIENEMDLEIQEKLLARFNWLIDNGIVDMTDHK
ncbi:hypothetical protein [Lacrimispora amygdalina]|uniref:hypothetical protein n=1 Tax=Lacrimispora amygdalina TaxID=253257 RepID=UPI000BE41184|nr:hypothetical protein [Lacrimispora amygdalina]